jgi:3-hydroxy acid dehydrogenase / malonic semialdehyde reductase
MNDTTILITGATSGFGEAMARRFASEGARLILTGRRAERLERLVAELGDADGAAGVLGLGFDLRDHAAMTEAITELPEAFQAVDVLVNNAGLALGLERAAEAHLSDWEAMIDTNIKGLVRLTRALLPGMVERGRGHIVNIGSIAGSYAYPGGSVYGATKAFVEQFSRNLLADLVDTPLRVTNIEPGLAETEFSVVRFKGDEAKAKTVYDGADFIRPEDIAEAVGWAITRPAHLNINRIEIMPVGQAAGPLAIHRSR